MKKVFGNEKGVADVLCVAVVVWLTVGIWGYFGPGGYEVVAPDQAVQAEASE